MIILAECRMTRGFNGKRSSYTLAFKPYALVNDIFITTLKSSVLAAERVFDKLSKSCRGYAVRYNRSAFAVFESDSRSQSNKAVTVNFLAVRTYASRTVNVRIKNYAEVCARFNRRLANRSHSRLIFGVRYVIREHSVGVKVS